jgi:hypothetical protein
VKLAQYYKVHVAFNDGPQDEVVMHPDSVLFCKLFKTLDFTAISHSLPASHQQKKPCLQNQNQEEKSEVHYKVLLREAHGAPLFVLGVRSLQPQRLLDRRGYRKEAEAG